MVVTMEKATGHGVDVATGGGAVLAQTYLQYSSSRLCGLVVSKVGDILFTHPYLFEQRLQERI